MSINKLGPEDILHLITGILVGDDLMEAVNNTELFAEILDKQKRICEVLSELTPEKFQEFQGYIK